MGGKAYGITISCFRDEMELLPFLCFSNKPKPRRSTVANVIHNLLKYLFHSCYATATAPSPSAPASLCARPNHSKDSRNARDEEGLMRLESNLGFPRLFCLFVFTIYKAHLNRLLLSRKEELVLKHKWRLFGNRL